LPKGWYHCCSILSFSMSSDFLFSEIYFSPWPRRCHWFTTSSLNDDDDPRCLKRFVGLLHFRNPYCIVQAVLIVPFSQFRRYGVFYDLFSLWSQRLRFLWPGNALNAWKTRSNRVQCHWHEKKLKMELKFLVFALQWLEAPMS
jgi:hypothetical protein